MLQQVFAVSASRFRMMTWLQSLAKRFAARLGLISACGSSGAMTRTQERVILSEFALPTCCHTQGHVQGYFGAFIGTVIGVFFDYLLKLKPRSSPSSREPHGHLLSVSDPSLLQSNDLAKPGY